MAYTPADVNAWYQAVQFRDGPTATVASTVALLNSGGITPANAQLSIINDSFTSTYVNPMVRIYQAAFNRVPDQAGQNFWVDNFAAGTVTPLTAAQNFANSAEFNATYGANASSPINAAVLTAFYQNVLNRAPDAAGYQFWLNSGQTVAQVLNYFAQSPEFSTNSSSAINQFQQAEINGTAATSGSLFQYGGYPTSTFTLTTGIDAPGVGAFAAGSPTGNSTIQGTMVYAAGGVTVDATSTLNTFDSIQATGSNNSLNLTVTGGNAATTFVPASISGVQTFNVRNVSGFTNSLDASTVSGLTAYNSNQSTSVVTVTNLASGASAGVIGNGSVANAASNFGWTAAAASGTLNLSSGTTSGAITLSGTGLLSQTVNSSLAANTIGALGLAATNTSLTINASTGLTTGAVTNTGGGAALTTITIGGAGAVNLSATALEAGVTKIDASKNSGGVTVALGSNAAQVVTGGSGNDVITTGGVLGTGSVDAGTGTADVLNVGTNVAHVNTSSLAAKYTNFDIIRVNGTLDMSLFPTITGVQLSGATNSITNMTAAQAASVQARADIGATTLTLATATGTSDVLNVAFGTGLTTSAATNAGVLTVTGFETLNLKTNAGPTATAGANRTTTVTGAIVDTSLTAVNLTGAAFTFTDASSTKAVTWDATALVGDGSATPVGLVITAPAGVATGSVFKGSEFADTFTVTGAANGSTYNGNGGNDTFVTTAAILLPSGATTDITINGGAGTDVLQLTGSSTLTDTSFVKSTNLEVLELAGAGVANSATGLAAGLTSAYANGITVRDTANQTGANAYTWSSGLYSQNVTLTHTTTFDGTSAGGAQSITTGGGADTVTLTASSWVGSAGVANHLTVATGAGVDTISVTTGTLAAVTVTPAVTITAGAGADILSVTHVNAGAALGYFDFVVAAGDSTTTAYDQITGFKLGVAATTLSDGIDFTNAGLTAYAATAVPGYTAAQLTVAVAANGAVTFAGTSAAGLALADKISAVASVVVTNQGDSAFFVDSGNTYVFNNDTAGDSVVELVGVAATSLITANATTGSAVFIH